jgi:hypothetical protein
LEANQSENRREQVKTTIFQLWSLGLVEVAIGQSGLNSVGRVAFDLLKEIGLSWVELGLDQFIC